MNQPRFPFVSVQTLRGNFPDEPFYLNPFGVEAFLDFLAGEPELSAAARERRWKVVVFRTFIDALPAARKTLARQLCEVESLQVRREDTWMVDEVLSLIFRSDVAQRARAELLVLARRRRQGQKLSLLSNCERLSTLPNAQTFFFSAIETSRDLPVDFHLLHDFKLHKGLAVAEDKWRLAQNGDEYSAAVQAAVTALQRSHTRLSSGNVG